MRAMSKREIAEFYRRLAETRPIPQTELEFINPFTLAGAVVLSAQATDAGVNKATPALFALADTPQKMLALGEERVIGLIRTIGLFRTKAKNLIALSRILVERHDGAVPREREALEALPGVGRKTASVVMNVAFGEPTIAVDTHIFRVANRTGLARRQDPAPGRARARKAHPAPIQGLRPSLADPARALCVQGAQARMPGLRRRRAMPLRGQDRPGRVDRGARLGAEAESRWPSPPASTEPPPPARAAPARAQPAARTGSASALSSRVSPAGSAWMSPEIWPPHSISIWP